MQSPVDPIARREFLSKSSQGAMGVAMSLSVAGGGLLWTPVADAADGAAAANASAPAPSAPTNAPPANAWLADSPFNLLVDYYTEVPFRPYGSGATRDNVVGMLRERIVTIEPGGVPAQTRWREGLLEVVLPRLEIHACLAIRPSPIT